MKKRTMKKRRREDSIAIIGYACRFPGAADADAYWRLLAAGQDVVGPVPQERWQLAGLAGAPARGWRGAF